MELLSKKQHLESWMMRSYSLTRGPVWTAKFANVALVCQAAECYHRGSFLTGNIYPIECCEGMENLAANQRVDSRP